MAYQFYNPTRVLFGAGQLNHLHEQTMPGKKAMVVISNGKSTRANGALDRTLEQLHMAGVETVLFDKVGANPLKAVVEEGDRLAKDNGCDFVVALGGGSVMDAAKVMAMYALQPGDLWDYVAGSTGKMQPLVNPTLPVIAITTTAGTGSEVDQWGVVTNLETNEKIGCGGQDSLFPVLAVVDPELMRTVPPKFTAYQGFDALFHSTEGYISAVTSPMWPIWCSWRRSRTSASIWRAQSGTATIWKPASMSRSRTRCPAIRWLPAPAPASTRWSTP